MEHLESRVVLNAAPVLLQPLNDSWRSAANDSASDVIATISPDADGFADAEIQLIKDFTADGVEDVLVEWPDGDWGLQVNDGTQLFLMPWGQGPADGAEVIDAADFDNDGLLDVLSFDHVTGDMWVSLNSIEDGFHSSVWTNFSPATDWLHLFVDDFDGDGRVDVLGGESGGGWWLGKNAQTKFQNHPWGRLPIVAWQDVLSADFSGDGLPDVVARAADNTWWLWQGSSTQLQLATYWGHWKMRDTWHDVAAADFNGDERADLIGRTEDGRVWVGSGLEDRFHTWTWGTGWVHQADWTNMTIVDMNGDDLPDQLGRANDDTWWYAENQGQRFENHYWQKSSQDAIVSDGFTRSTAIDLRQTLQRTRPVEQSDVDSAPVHVSLDSDNKLVISGTSVELLGLDIKSASGSLIPADDDNADPFQIFLANNRQQSTLGSVGVSVLLDGSITLNVGWDPSGEKDLTVVYGGPEDDGLADVDDLLDGGVFRDPWSRGNYGSDNRSVYRNIRFEVRQ